MPIGPMGEPLPYNNGAPVGNPMGVQAPNPDALMQELSVLAQRAQEIMAQLQSMGIDPTQMGGPTTQSGVGGIGPEVLAPPPEMPMPPVGSMPPGGLLA